MRRLILATAAVLCLVCSATPVRAENDYGENTQLRGRGFGRGIAVFYNGLDKSAKRALNISVVVVVLLGIAAGVRHFCRESREAFAPRQKEPWEVG